MKRIWLPAIVIPVIVTIFVVAMIVVIGEILLFMNELGGNAVAVGTGVGIMALITIVSVILGVRYEREGA
ncbi:MAG: hypothetical protein IRY97_11035 [Thermomicrobiaceae bacterium]|nr:hypothetical protein [Thermomicrobiaceae bacterium]